MEYEEETGYESESSVDSEVAALQEAFAEGRLKPGLNIEKKTFVNNEVMLNRKLNEITLRLPWIEKLDIISKPAPMASELADKLKEEREKIVKQGKNPKDDLILNDFERESMFLRQAQSAVMKGVSQLKELGILTKRPDDYFAEMAKTDSHMQKVRGVLLSQRNMMKHAEKVRQMRKMRKIDKEMQRKARVEKINEKREFLDQVKKYRQKMSNNLDFLEDKPKPKPKTSVKKDKKKPVNKRTEAKRMSKAQKYGMGGKKRGTKHNTQESAANFTFHKKEGKAKFTNKNKPLNRAGKSKRIKQKAARKR